MLSTRSIILQKASHLFGCCSLNVWGVDLGYSTTYQKTDCRNSLLDEYSEVRDDKSLFDFVRQLPLSQQKPVQMAHSGIIGNGIKRVSEDMFKVSA